MNLHSLIHEPGIILYLSVMGETEEAEKGALAEHFGNKSVLSWWPLVTFIVLWRVPECPVN